jgi:tetratricopeptide (TPR) repeat protein
MVTHGATLQRSGEFPITGIFRASEGGDDQSSSLLRFALSCREEGRLAEAATACRDALTLRRQRSGPFHADVAEAMLEMGRIKRAQQDWAEAEAIYLAALAVGEKAYRTQRASLAVVVHELGLLYRDTGRRQEALRHLERAIRIFEQTSGAGNEETMTAAGDYAVVLMAEGQFSEAEPILRRVSKHWWQTLGGSHPRTLEALYLWATSSNRQGKHGEAARVLRQVLNALPLGTDEALRERVSNELALAEFVEN